MFDGQDNSVRFAGNVEVTVVTVINRFFDGESASLVNFERLAVGVGDGIDTGFEEGDVDESIPVTGFFVIVNLDRAIEEAGPGERFPEDVNQDPSERDAGKCKKSVHVSILLVRKM